jgi:hypothetical protein
MKVNVFKVTAVLYFKSGNSKKVDWIEDRLVKRLREDERDVTEPLTLEEADAFFQGKFKDWKESGATIVRKNAKGENSVIPFSEIEYATVTVEQINNTAPEQPAEEEKPQVRSIKDHPAYKPLQ